MKLFIVDIKVPLIKNPMKEWRLKMLNPKEWGGEIVLVLASELLHVNSQIIPAFGEVAILKSSSESSNKHPLWLFHFSEVDFRLASTKTTN